MHPRKKFTGVVNVESINSEPGLDDFDPDGSHEGWFEVVLLVPHADDRPFGEVGVDVLVGTCIISWGGGAGTWGYFGALEGQDVEDHHAHFCGEGFCDGCGEYVTALHCVGLDGFV